MYKEFILSLEDINKVVDYLKNIVITSENIVVLLEGDLASGKTTLIKYLLEKLDSKSSVTSPTFSIQNIYEGKFFHYDIYNRSLEEFISLGMIEEFEKNGIHFVEWSNEKLEELLKNYGFKTIKITIDKLEDKRRYIIYDA